MTVITPATMRHPTANGQRLTMLSTLFSGSGNVTIRGAALSGAVYYPGSAPADCIWVDEEVPLGGVTKDCERKQLQCNWISSNPTPYSGASPHQSAPIADLPKHYFQAALSGYTFAPTSRS